MRFALLGDHPDGLDMARALVESGRHKLAIYCGPVEGRERLARWELRPRFLGDLEETLAAPDLEAVIVAGRLDSRPIQLRRALQSEHHVLCVHPASDSPDSAYEAALLQNDVKKVLLPLLPWRYHPALRRLEDIAAGTASPVDSRFQAASRQRPLTSSQGPAVLANPPPATLGSRLIELEIWSAEELLAEGDALVNKPWLPGWDLLRFLGGEIAEIFALAPELEEMGAEPLLLTGKFESNRLFQVTILPCQTEPRWRLALVLRQGKIELAFPEGWPGPALLSWLDEAGQQRREPFAPWNPWPSLVAAFEDALDLEQKTADAGPHLDWQEEVRCLELDEAARRSVESHRTSVMEYQEVSEEVGFKGTMTLLGCGLLLVCVLFLIFSAWSPWLGWAILPLIGLFLFLQMLRLLVPAPAAPRRWPGQTAMGPPPPPDSRITARPD